MNERASTSEGSKKRRLVLGGYLASVQDKDAKERHLENLNFTGGIDSYETEKEWNDDVGFWPSITYINLAMYMYVTRLPVRTVGMTF